MNHDTELVWYEDGKLYTQREYLSKLWGRAVSENDALEYVRKKKFVKSIIQRSHLLKINEQNHV